MASGFDGCYRFPYSFILKLSLSVEKSEMKGNRYIHTNWQHMQKENIPF